MDAESPRVEIGRCLASALFFHELAQPVFENRLCLRICVRANSLLSVLTAVIKGHRLFHSKNDLALTSEPNFCVAKQLERHQHPVWILYFSLFVLINLLILLRFSCCEHVKLNRKGIEFKYNIIENGEKGVMCVRVGIISL